jgi:hypothetical protein
MVMAKLTEAVPGKLYTVKCHLYDAAGQEIGPFKPYSFTPVDPTFSFWFSTKGEASPNYKIHKPGTWLRSRTGRFNRRLSLTRPLTFYHLAPVSTRALPGDDCWQIGSDEVSLPPSKTSPSRNETLRFIVPGFQGSMQSVPPIAGPQARRELAGNWS